MGSDKKDLVDDFCKILLARADHRVMIFSANSKAGAEKKIFGLIDGLEHCGLTCFGDRYLFAGLLENDGTFLSKLHKVKTGGLTPSGGLAKSQCGLWSFCNKRDIAMWRADHFRLFICHDSSDKEVAHLLKEELEKIQVSCFVAHDDIEPIREWQDEIEEALRTMDALAAILSPNFHQSKWPVVRDL